ncbi:ovalbumin-related protein X-like [Vanessa atalanta]|uniref:ovalbumin-related protein X-like n=1 Tax=Vanessa atalanta TaxID=42275 RepID=UPI001FCD85C3|nr:ovalbumin-related protein X-like [Vanessa atalanta]
MYLVTMVKITFAILLLTPVLCVKCSCNHESAVNTFKRPTYDFSVQLLDRVAQETGYHFVFSPLSTWLQLMTLAEGARGPTEREIRKVTRYHRMLCFRRKYKEVLNGMDEELGFMTKRTNVIIINKLLNVKNSFQNEIQKSNSTKILSLNFNEPDDAAAKVNDIIQMDTDGVIKDSIQAEDFNMSVLLMTETAYFKSDWKTSFNPVYTSTEPFFSEDKVPIGNVRLMSQTGYFNLTTLPLINAKVIELPFNTNDRISMLVFLPTKSSVQNLLYYLKDIRLMTIFNNFKREGTKLATVRIPRFNIKTELENIPELVYDMGVKRIFYPDLADFGGISDFKMHTSLMTQVADIEVTEKGATAGAVAEFLIVGNNEELKADRPFVYLIVDRKTDVILFGGIYSTPNIY